MKKLAQSILRYKFSSVYKPLKKGLEKYKPQGLFSEFYRNQILAPVVQKLDGAIYPSLSSG